MKVVIVGGGYAGLACAIALRRCAPGAAIELVDPDPWHLKVTHLHETLDRPLEKFRVSFAELGERFGFTHHRGEAGAGGRFDAEDLRAWQAAHELPVAGEHPLAFDYLVIATGARSRPAGAGPHPERCFDKDDLRRREGAALLAELVFEPSDAPRHVSVVGGGASGVQYAFALAEAVRRHAAPVQLRLVHAQRQLLPQLPRAVHEYAAARLAEAGVALLSGTEFVAQSGATMRVRNGADGEASLPSDLTLLFPGLAPHPCALRANRHGQVYAGTAVLPGIFAAGDCVWFESPGLNTLSAQAALRKGRLVGGNIARLHRGRPLLGYAYAELGYVVSLGPLDAAGWALLPENVVTGLAAFAAKELVEAQYDLLLGGLDTYLL